MPLPLTGDYMLALAGFSLASSITPGPNNLMLLASGVNHGFRRTIPHMLGIGLGFCFLLLCVGQGLGQMFEAVPQAYTLLKVAGGGYLVWLAWKIANSGPVESRGREASRPMTFLEASAFQWVNPKAWVMAVTSMSVYTNPEAHTVSVFMVAAMFTVINIPSVSLWCGLGTGLRNFLAEPARLRLFNWTMALLLVASLWPMLR